ncbi:hypothetical protein ACHAXT_003995 [Thalassiosira profunda]
MARTLLVGGVISILVGWTWVLFSFSSSLPGPASHPSAMHPATGGERIRHNLDDGSLSAQNYMHNITHGELSAAQNNIETKAHRHLRPKEEESQPHRLEQPAPLSSLIYPLHAKSGTHHAYLYVGTPPQRQTLIVDTGSRLTAFPCQPHCPDCGEHASPQYVLNASSTHDIVPCGKCRLSASDYPVEDYFLGDRIGGNSGDGPSLRGAASVTQRKRSLYSGSCVNNRCDLDQKYTEGSSWKAFEVKDNVWLGLDALEASARDYEAHSTPFVFGCQVSESGLFKTQYADGIMGLSMYTTTLAGTWHRHGAIQHQSFSLCFNREGGHMSLGGIGSVDPVVVWEEGTRQGKLQVPMQYTPFAKENVWYYTVTVTSISVGEHVLPRSILQFVNDHKGTIVDSGTTDTFISHHVAKPFIAAWERITRRKYSNRIQQYTHEEFSKLPVITFELEGGVIWEINPEAYMEPQPPHANEWEHGKDGWKGKRGFISRVYVDEPQGVVLGSNAMIDKEILFDVANRRLGVAKATCAY